MFATRMILTAAALALALLLPGCGSSRMAQPVGIDTDAESPKRSPRAAALMPGPHGRYACTEIPLAAPPAPA